MSYDLLIHFGDDVDEPTDELFSVDALVQAFNAFPPFREAGATWEDESWQDDPRFGGLMIDLENHAPARRADGTFDYAAGEAQICRIYRTAGSPLSIAFVRRLAQHLADAVGATMHDPQEG